MPQFRLGFPDGTFEVVELDELLDRLHPHADRAQIILDLTFKPQTQVKLRTNVATVTLWRNEAVQEVLPLPSRQDYVAQVELTFSANTHVKIRGADSTAEAESILEHWQAGDASANDKVTIDGPMLIENLRTAVDDVMRHGSVYSLDGMTVLSCEPIKLLPAV